MAFLKVGVFLSIALFSSFVLSDEDTAGGLGELEDADDEIQQLADAVRDVVETKDGVNYEEFTAVSYREQIVKGTIFFVKIQVSDSEFIHAKILKQLPGEPGAMIQLLDVETGKSADDAIEYFK